jgi:acyl carrier protein phosphodiesterase
MPHIEQPGTKEMNWLAHLLLADPASDCQISAILPDFMRKTALGKLPESFQVEIIRHRRIDAYTDSHPAFRRSVRRFGGTLRHFGPVVADIFYDHFVSTHWLHYSEISLPDFLTEIFASLDRCGEHLPEDTLQHLWRVKEENWLASYADIDGLSRCLTRISLRLRRFFDLASSIPVFLTSYNHFRADFEEFFPDLLRYLGISQLRARAAVNARNGNAQQCQKYPTN